MAPLTKMLRMSLKLQIKESNLKDVLKLLILNEKNKVSLRDVKIWRHDVIYRYTAQMWRHKLESCLTIEPLIVESWLTPHFFHYQMVIRFW